MTVESLSCTQEKGDAEGAGSSAEGRSSLPLPVYPVPSQAVLRIIASSILILCSGPSRVPTAQQHLSAALQPFAELAAESSRSLESTGRGTDALLFLQAALQVHSPPKHVSKRSILPRHKHQPPLGEGCSILPLTLLLLLLPLGTDVAGKELGGDL